MRGSSTTPGRSGSGGGGILQQIYAVWDELRAEGVSREDILQEVRARRPDAEWARQGRSLQASIQRMLRARLPPVEPVARKRMERWDVGDLPAAVAHRAVLSLREAWKLTTPRVAFAFLSTLFNRWTTPRRFQQKGVCSPCHREGTEDSLEHFFFCGRTKVVLQYMGPPREAGEGGAAGFRRRFLILDGTT